MTKVQLISKDDNKLCKYIRRQLIENGCEVVATSEEASFSIVLGGDGTVLAAARAGLASPAVIINTGHLGFLTSSNNDASAKQLIHTILNEAGYTPVCTNRLMLDVKVSQGSGSDLCYHAVNDIVLTKNGLAKLTTCRVSIAEPPDYDHTLLSEYRADGLIVATPTGSTAYSLSAGGPIIHPRCQSLVVSPICPQGLTQRPMVLPADVHLGIQPLTDDLYLSVDGQIGVPLSAHSFVTITYGTHSIQTVNPTMTYYEVLRGKLGWGIKPV